MPYKVFHTDVPLPAGVKEPDYSRLITFAHDTLDEALARASALIKVGAVVWKIEGPSGAVEMDRAQVAQACAPDRVRFRVGARPIVESTGGMPHKQHEERSVQLPPKRPAR